MGCKAVTKCHVPATNCYRCQLTLAAMVASSICKHNQFISVAMLMHYNDCKPYCAQCLICTTHHSATLCWGHGLMMGQQMLQQSPCLHAQITHTMSNMRSSCASYSHVPIVSTCCGPVPLMVLIYPTQLP